MSEVPINFLFCTSTEFQTYIAYGIRDQKVSNFKLKEEKNMNNSREMMSVLRADLQAFVLIEVAPNLYNLSGSFGGEIYDLAPTCYVSGVEFPLYLSKDRDAAPAGTIRFKADEVHFAGNSMAKRKAVLVRDGEVLQLRVVNTASFIHHLPANFDTFYMCQVSETEYVLKIVIDGEVLDIGDDCGLDHEYPLSFDLDTAPEGIINFDSFNGTTCSGADGVEHTLFLLRKERTNRCHVYFVEDLTSKEDLREMIDELSTMESWEKRHFLEWVTAQEEAIILDHGKFAIFGQEELSVWVERYYKRNVVMLTDFILENIIEKEVDVHLQVPHPQAFKEFSSNHALMPVERQRTFVAGKGDTVVVFNGKTWKIIYVF